MKKKFSSSFGKFLANVQLILDDVVIWGFKKLKNTKPAKKTPKTTTEKATNYLSKLAAFLGETGTAYYKHYETKKAEKKEKNKK